jgi:hypothetical protein
MSNNVLKCIQNLPYDIQHDILLALLTLDSLPPKTFVDLLAFVKPIPSIWKHVRPLLSKYIARAEYNPESCSNAFGHLLNTMDPWYLSGTLKIIRDYGDWNDFDQAMTSTIIASGAHNHLLLHFWTSSIEAIPYFASKFGRVDVLTLWRDHIGKSNIKRFATNSLELASEMGHVSILQWWYDQGRFGKYTPGIIERAIDELRWDVADWWINKSGYNLYGWKYPVDLELF